jgi:hypothetical protein
MGNRPKPGIGREHVRTSDGHDVLSILDAAQAGDREELLRKADALVRGYRDKIARQVAQQTMLLEAIKNMRLSVVHLREAFTKAAGDADKTKAAFDAFMVEWRKASLEDEGDEEEDGE